MFPGNRCGGDFAVHGVQDGGKPVLFDKVDKAGPGATCDPEENGRLIVELIKKAGTLNPDILFVDFHGQEVPW